MNSKMELVSGSVFGLWAGKRGKKSVLQLWAALSIVEGGSMGNSMGWDALGVMSPLPNTKTWLEEATL